MLFAPDPGRSLRPSRSSRFARPTAAVVVAVAAALALGPVAPASAATATDSAPRPTAYVLNGTAGTMSAVDTATGTVTATVNASAPDGIGSAPDAEAVSPDGSRVYVVNDGDNSVSVIDTATGKVTARVPVGRNPLGAVVGPTGRTVAVTGDNVYLIHANSLKATRLRTVLRPAGVAFSPDGTELYVSCRGSLLVFDTATGALADTLSAADGSLPVISADGTTAYVLSGAGVPTVTVVDIATDTAVATIPVSEGQGGYDSLTLSPDGTELYADIVGTMNVISTSDDTVSTSYPAVGHVVFSPNGALAYEAAFTTQDTGITAIDPATGAVVGSIPAAGSFLDLAFSPDSSRAYVASTSEVQVYDTATSSLIATVPTAPDSARSPSPTARHICSTPMPGTCPYSISGPTPSPRPSPVRRWTRTRSR
ncbi:YncE family protein [Streptacidiphilus sp. 4-A2]|nr:YncE family protein [Streptacidiphilus sp. 4-A2]